MTTTFYQSCWIFLLLALLLPPFAKACEYCGDNPCTCEYCSICGERPCVCVKLKEEKEPEQSTPAQKLVLKSKKSGKLLKLPTNMFTSIRRFMFSGGASASPEIEMSTITGTAERECETSMNEDPDRKTEMFLSLLQQFHNEDGLDSADKALVSLFRQHRPVNYSDSVVTTRNLFRKTLKTVNYGLCGLSALTKSYFNILGEDVEEILLSTKYSNHYLFIIHFNSNAILSFFFHTFDNAFNVLVIFHGTQYVIPKYDFQQLINQLLANKDAKHAYLDQIRKGIPSQDPKNGTFVL